MATSTPTSAEQYDAEAAAWLYANSSDGFALLENGRIVSANPAWCAIHGFDVEQVIGQHALKTIHPEDHSIYFEAASRLRSEGAMSMEHRVCTGDGRLIWVRLTVKTAQGGLSMAVIKDITSERTKQLEEDHALHISELLRASAGISMWKFDPDTDNYSLDLTEKDNDLSAPVRVSPGQMGDNIHPDDLKGFGAVFIPTLRTGEPGSYAYRYRVPHPDGGEVWAHYHSAWRGVRQCASGKWEVRGLSQDITEIADARDAALRGEQAAKDAADTKAHFLANMSHEIRTPLNGVLGVLHLLKHEPLSEEGRQLVAQALGCGGMLTELLNDVLDFSKLEAGKLELIPEPVDPATVLKGVVDMLAGSAASQGLYLRLDIAKAPASVFVDPVRLRQLLFNLIGNAVKFTLKGGVEIRMSSIPGASSRLRVEVQDTGVGIAPEAVDALFERFNQGDGSATRRFGGTGLGLAITRSLVEQMGGEIEVRSAVGEGSTFSFEILAPDAAAGEETPVGEGPLLEGIRVLLVEDNPTNQMIASRMLESLGATIALAENGAIAVEAVQIQEFDLVFMDIQMPVMDGVEATRRIRALQGPASELPILAVTANVMAHQLVTYRAAGMDGAIPKPLNPATIIAEISRLASGPDPDQNVGAVAA